MSRSRQPPADCAAIQSRRVDPLTRAGRVVRSAQKRHPYRRVGWSVVDFQALELFYHEGSINRE